MSSPVRTRSALTLQTVGCCWPMVSLVGGKRDCSENFVFQNIKHAVNTVMRVRGGLENQFLFVDSRRLYRA